MSADPCLQRLLTQGFRCASCNDLHIGVFDLAFANPMYWSGSNEKEPDETVESAMSAGRDILTKNFCLDGDHRFVRGIIPFKIKDSDETFAFGVWGSLSPQSFGQYLDHFFGREAELMSPAFSWLSNRLPLSEDRPVKGRLRPQPRSDRPTFEIGEEDHPFFSAQREGLTVDRLLEIYANSGHDLRDTLA